MMKYITGTTDFQIKEPAIVTIGKFDGRHRGHQKLLSRMQREKERLGCKTAVFTFDRIPDSPGEEKTHTVITTNSERKNNLEKNGIDYLIEYPFTEETKRMSPREFVQNILVGRMNARLIIVGTDCSFGYRGAGGAADLKKWKSVYGYELIVLKKEQDGCRDISSTFVREALNAGNIEMANRLLGQPFSVHGIVVHGNHIGGKMLGFPTANLLPPPVKHLPAFGVYISKVYLDGAYYGGVTNIGRKPTVAGEWPAGVETFLFGIDEDIYGKNIEVQLLSFLRPERKFDGLGSLKEQIGKDRDYALAYLNNLSDEQITRLPEFKTK